MPRVKVQSVEVKLLGAGLSEVTATVTNDRMQPTHSAADVKSKITPPDIVSIEGKDLKVIAGLQSDEKFFQRPKEQKRDPAKMKIDSIPGMKAVYVRWIVEGAGPYNVKLKSVKGGSDEKTSDAK
jgi:hypothetical protein